MQANSYVNVFEWLPVSLTEYGFVAGGALRAVHDGTDVSDIDVFFETQEAHDAAVKAMRWDVDWLELPAAARNTRWTRRDVDTPPVNLIGFAFGSPQDTVARFDFRCCRHAARIVSNEALWVYSESGAIVDARERRLVVMQNNGDERTQRRIAHYVNDYGYELDLSHEDHLLPQFVADLERWSDDPDGFLPTVRFATPEKRRRARRYFNRIPRRSALGY